MELIQNFFETLSTLVFPSIFRLLFIVFIAFFAKHLINLGTDNFVRKSKNIRRAETLRQIVHSTSKVIIITIAGMMILHELGFDIRPIIASAGILGVAFGLGAQHLMKDVINGFFILLEDQFGIGDSVKIGDHSGIVEKMNLRTTTLKDQNGNVHIIPNSQINQVTILSPKI
ncbi:MAG: mechanosensitive ion channel [Candidatus Melainabacteria bacterium]|nr:mechanosensitive ion channel [Candidatus Melainabacteria bacterium]